MLIVTLHVQFFEQFKIFHLMTIVDFINWIFVIVTRIIQGAEVPSRFLEDDVCRRVKYDIAPEAEISGGADVIFFGKSLLETCLKQMVKVFESQEDVFDQF